MTAPSPHDPGSSAFEQLLRDRLHEIDEVTPPEGRSSFEDAALAAGRRRQSRRSWTRGLVAAAAVVVVGGAVVPQLPLGGSQTSSVTGAPAPEQGSGPGDSLQPAPGYSTRPTQQPDSQGDRGGGGSGSTTSPVAYDWTSTDAQARLARLRATLATPPYAATPTTLVVDSSVSPAALQVRMARPDAAVEQLVRDAFPHGVPLIFTVATP